MRVIQTCVGQIPTEEQGFNITPTVFCNKEAFLITPKIDAKWTKDNLFFRSVIVDNEGNILSSGFPKFFNYGEKKDYYPDPTAYTDWRIDAKIDGSLLIVDYVNGVHSIRTRGTSVYTKHENAKDFELLWEKYPKIQNFLQTNTSLSLLFEIVTPNNIIVVRPKDIDFFLLGAIDKKSLRQLTSTELISIWREIGEPSTPEQYIINNITNLDELASFIKQWRGKEGIVLSYNKGQNKIKIKSDWYCWIHRIKSMLSTTNNLIDYYVELGMPEGDEFYRKIETEYDYELANQIKDEIYEIADVGTIVKKIINDMRDFVASIRGFETRKQQAEHIFTIYKAPGYASMVFNLLNGKPLEKKHITLLIHQNYKK